MYVFLEGKVLLDVPIIFGLPLISSKGQMLVLGYWVRPKERFSLLAPIFRWWGLCSAIGPRNSGNFEASRTKMQILKTRWFWETFPPMVDFRGGKTSKGRIWQEVVNTEISQGRPTYSNLEVPPNAVGVRTDLHQRTEDQGPVFWSTQWNQNRFEVKSRSSESHLFCELWRSRLREFDFGRT